MVVVVLLIAENYTYGDVVKPVLKFNFIISLEVLIIILLLLPLLGIQDVLAQEGILIDTDAVIYYSNPFIVGYT